MKNINEKIQAAVNFATAQHKDQWRKSTGLPYITHPNDVLKKIASWGLTKKLDYDLWVAALLHDTVEDGDTSVQEISKLFGTYVGLLVAELTFRPQHTDESSKDYALAKHEYLASFDHKHPGSLVIKNADRFCNVEDYLSDDPAYAVKYFHKADVLFSATKRRLKEIESVFGQTLVDCWLYDYDVLADEIRHVDLATK